MVKLVSYKDIAKRYEEVARLESDELRRVGWNNKERAILRYDFIMNTAIDLVNKASSDIVLYDIGCGLCSLHDYIEDAAPSRMKLAIKYRGFDLSNYLVAEALSMRPNLDVCAHDFLNPQKTIQSKCDLAVMNGIFTQKFSLSRQMMLDFIIEMISAVKIHTLSVIMFNVMSDEVDYTLENAFHMSQSQIEEVMATLKIDRYFIDRVTPYEYFVRVYV